MCHIVYHCAKKKKNENFKNKTPTEHTIDHIYFCEINGPNISYITCIIYVNFLDMQPIFLM